MAWLSDWNKRIKLTISGSCIEGDLSDFPIMIHLDSTCSGVFNELGANSKKIAVTISGEVSQCYVEVENWDNGNNKAWLWTKVPTLFSGIDTDIYLYYDSSKDNNYSYVGDVGSSVAQNVWDENFVGVWHMNQDPTGGSACIKDSTSNINHGTPAGSMISGDLVDGKVGKALDFDGSNDYISVSSFYNTADLTVECIANITTDDSWFLNKRDAASDDQWQLINYNNYLRVSVYDGSSAVGSITDGISIVGAGYKHIGFVTSGLNGESLTLYCNGAVTGTPVTLTGNMKLGARDLIIGKRGWSSGGPVDGIMDELRISNSARSASWIKATYYSNWNQLLNYGNEENSFHCCFSGVVKVEDVPSVRKVNLYAQSTGELIKCTTSSGGTGEWAINVCGDINAKYFVVCVPESDSRNAEVFANLIGV